MKGFVVSSILTTHLVVGSFSSHSTFIAESTKIFVTVRTPRCRWKIFRQLSQLRSTTTPSRLPGPDLSSRSNSGIRRLATHLHTRHFSLAASPTHWRVRRMGPLPATTLHLQLRRPPISLLITLLLHFGAKKMPLFPFFFSDDWF